MIEKIKKNKLKSAFIYLSAFLFGFTAITIFNNVGGTYSTINTTVTDSGGGGGYKCPSGWHFAGFSALVPGASACCPNGYNYDNSLDVCYTKPTSTSLRQCPSPGEWSDVYLNGNNVIDKCRINARKAVSVNTFSLQLLPNGGTTTSKLNYSCNTSYSIPNYCQINELPIPAKDGYYFRGWGTTANCTAGTYGYVKMTENRTLYACWVKSKEIEPAPGTDANGGGTMAPTSSSGAGETITAITRSFYTITYDLDGGHFIDESETRKEIVSSDKSVGGLKTNPIKDGYKFKEWQLNNTTFDFDTKPTENITLKAIYEEDATDETLTCNTGDIFEPTSGKCYKVLEEDTQKFTHTTYLYPENSRFCYAYNEGVSDGGVYFNTGTKYTVEGKNNQSYDGYEGSDTWIPQNTCLIASQCQLGPDEIVRDDDINDDYGCLIKWSAIIYHEYDPASSYISDGNDVEIIDDTTEPEEDDNVEESPKTGDAIIYVAVVIGLATVGYSVYYFIKKRKVNI